MNAQLNVTVVRVFAPLLLIVGALGFVVPERLALTSGATPYNVFHLVFGLVGLGCVAVGDVRAARAFTIGFGLIDLYQAIASAAELWPKQAFAWKPVDDLLHVIIGVGLVGVGLVAGRPSTEPRPHAS